MASNARPSSDRPERVPDLDWKADRARRFADGVVDLWEELLGRLREMPVTKPWRRGDVRAAVSWPIPDEPLSDEDLLYYLREVTFEWSMYPGHPRFMAYISGAGTVPGAVADLLASGLNMNPGGWRLSPSATEIEQHVLRWFAREFGLPRDAGGLFVSGGAMATFVALKVARDRQAGWDVRARGVSGGPPLAVYASDEVHVVSDRALDMLGLGQQALRKIPTDGSYRMRMDALAETIDADRAAGVRPIAVVASAGSVATGSIDPLPDIADLCDRERLWFHVDAAYGGPAILAEDLRPLFVGIDRADSIAFDPHKWLYTPLTGGCLIVRDMGHLPESFSVAPSYVYQDPQRVDHGTDYVSMGPQFSRGFQALKVMVSLLAHGRRAYGERISHDAELARYLGRLVEERPDFELMTPVNLSICCFRYVPPDLAPGEGPEMYLNRLNERLMMELQLDGRVFCSNAVLGGRFGLRACIVNFRTEAEDVEALVDIAEDFGRKLDEELRPAELRLEGAQS